MAVQSPLSTMIIHKKRGMNSSYSWATNFLDSIIGEILNVQTSARAWYIEDAERRNASSVWNDWPCFGDVRGELNRTADKFGRIDSWEDWQAYMIYIDEVQEGFYNTYEELTRKEMRERARGSMGALCHIDSTCILPVQLSKNRER